MLEAFRGVDFLKLGDFLDFCDVCGICQLSKTSNFFLS